MNNHHVKAKDYEATKFDDVWIVLNTDNYTVTQLNEVGGFCWTLLSEEPQTLDSLVKAIEKNFMINTPSEMIVNDIKEFLSNLDKCGLVHYVY